MSQVNQDPDLYQRNIHVNSRIQVLKDNESITKLFDIELKVVHIRCLFGDSWINDEDHEIICQFNAA